jgi:methionine-rich copper-binding protein CopC
MNTLSIRKFRYPLVLLFVLLACAVPVLPLPAESSPTMAPGAIQTIVVATAGAAQTQTALVLPSPTETSTSTLLPTSTPTDTPTPTATFLLATATPPPTATQPFVTQSAGSGCELVAQLPSNDTVYASRARFTAEWTLKNTGSESWLSSNIDFSRASGRDMSGQDVYDLPNNVGPGAQVTLTVDMRAPADAGTYTANWRLGSKNKPLCEVSVRIIVK